MSENNDNQQTLTTPFVDRTGANLNRRKLTIISQTPNEMIVDVARFDNLDPDNGSKINAETLNSKFQSIVNQINTMDTGTMVKIGTEFCPDLTFTSDPQTQITNEVAARTNADTNLQSQINTKLSTTDLLNSVYPVGSIYMSVVNTNPSTLFGGTWVSWGNGRVPLSIGNNGESNYTTPEQTGGSENSIASHTHTQQAHMHGLWSSVNDNSNAYWNSTAIAVNNPDIKAIGGCTLAQSLGEYYRNQAGSGKNVMSTVAPTINSTGDSGGNRMPFITCYMWKRTA